LISVELRRVASSRVESRRVASSRVESRTRYLGCTYIVVQKIKIESVVRRMSNTYLAPKSDCEASKLECRTKDKIP
jgi:hypothetical protein